MTDSIKIADHYIGREHPPFIIAEMSGNHNQSLDRALKIVEAAAAAGAHSIKLQTYTADTITMDLQEGDFFIDDEKTLIDIGKKLLQSLGYTVITCSGSFEALEKFEHQSGKFDLVITDQTMPHMTGFDLAKRLLKINPSINVILCTGYSEIVTQEKAESEGIKTLIYKPIRKKEIAGIIREVLDKHNHQ